MNERIKELANQCFYIPVQKKAFGEAVEKFAALIEDNVGFSEPYLTGKADGQRAAIIACIEYIRTCGDISRAIDMEEHFGVE